MKIFISYRHTDKLAKWEANRLRENLTAGRRKRTVFVDVHDMGHAPDYIAKIKREVMESDFVLVLIGPAWLEAMKERQRSGKGDTVRLEIETALAHGIELVPILLDDTTMPDASDLPPSIARLNVANGHPLNAGPTYHLLLDRITRYLDDELARRSRPRTWWRSPWSLFAGSNKATPRQATDAPSGPLSAAAGGATPVAALDAQPVAPTWPSVADLKPLNVVIVLSAGVPYERELVEGFKSRLAQELPSRGLTLKVLSEKVGPGTIEAETQERREARWQSLFEHLTRTLGTGSVDYVVSVATFASTMVKKHRLVRALGAKGQIYMGMTSPPKSGLTGQPGIAGVQYGTGGREYALMFDELFPETQKLVFLYNDHAEHEQDRGYAAEIAGLNDELREKNDGKDRFELRPLKRNMEIRDLKDFDAQAPGANEVYMAWYDLDDLVSGLSQRGDAALARSSAWVVPSTYTMENINLFGAIVGVNDALGGWTAADIMLQLIDKPDLKPESIPMASHGFRVTLKPPVVERRKLPIREEAFHRQQDPRYRYE